MSDMGQSFLDVPGGLELEIPIQTPAYAAPEVIVDRKGTKFGRESDIFSLGLTALYLKQPSLRKNTPDNTYELLEQIASVAYDPDLSMYFTECSRLASVNQHNFTLTKPRTVEDGSLFDIMRQMLQPDPKKRATLAQIASHPFLERKFQPRNPPLKYSPVAYPETERYIFDIANTFDNREDIIGMWDSCIIQLHNRNR
jgi:serine/threonine protein kinase